MDPGMSADAATLPEGTQIEHYGQLFTAYPGQPFPFNARWRHEYAVMSDAAMTAALAAGTARVVGVNEAAVETYRQVLADCIDPAGR
jgi:hypothetical protein